MNFSDITKAAHDVWIFIWPPLVMLLIAWGLSRFLHRENTQSWGAAAAAKIAGSRPQMEAVQAALKTYGLSKIVPFISLAIVIFAFYILNGPVMRLSANLPPQLVFIPSELVADRISERELLLLLRRYPAADGLGEAWSLAQEEIRNRQTAQLKPYDRLQAHYRAINLLKFALLTATVLLFLHLAHGTHAGRTIVRYLAVLLTIGVLWSALFPFQLFNHAQSIYDEMRAVQIMLQPDAKELLAATPTQREQVILAQSKDNGQRRERRRWWRLQIWDAYIVEWTRRNIFGELR